MLLDYRVCLFFPTWFPNVGLVLGEDGYIWKLAVFGLDYLVLNRR